MEKIRVLVADDMNVIAEMVKEELEKLDGVEVIGISNDGQDEYDKICELQPKLVFTYNQMPKLNGIEVIELVRNLKLEKKPDFVMITGDSINRVNSLGVIKVLNKSVIDGDIEEVIKGYRLKSKLKKNKKQKLTMNYYLIGFRIKKAFGKRC